MVQAQKIHPLPKEREIEIAAALMDRLRDQGIRTNQAVGLLILALVGTVGAHAGTDPENPRHFKLAHELEQSLKTDVARFILQIRLLQAAGQF